MAGSSDPSSGQCEGFYPDEHGLVAQSSPNHYLNPDWDSPSVTAVDDEEEAVDSQRLLGLLPHSDSRSNGVLAGDCTSGWKMLAGPKTAPQIPCWCPHMALTRALKFSRIS
jgi:hypothetical protein